jgi:hypothetical protein
MAFYKIKSGRVNSDRDAVQYVAPYGQIFYDDEDNVLRIGDGVTPGGNLVFPTATSSTIGGIKLGPGIVLNGQGQIIIDSEGLDFSFGDFAATTGTYPSDYFDEDRQDQDYSVLSSINSNEDIILASNGTGAVRVVGDFSVRRANGNVVGALDEQPIFRVKSDGQVQMLVPSADSAEGAFTIVGGVDGVFQAPVNTGVMLHITGIASSPDPTPSRIYNDAQNSFSAIVSRRYNGTAAAPTAVLADQEIMRLSGTAHNGTLIPGTGNQRIVYVARGNQTTSNQGGAIELWATPLNSTTLAKVATVDSTGITLESGKVLTGNVTGTATTATFAQSFNTGTLVTNAVSAQSATTAGTVTTAAQPAITSVGTLTSLTVSGSITDSIGNVRSIAIRNTATSYVLTAADNGQMVSITTGSVTINSGIFASPFGQTISIYNNSTTSMSILAGSGVTLRLAGTLSTGTRTLARYGVATTICVSSNTFVVSGAGLS